MAKRGLLDIVLIRYNVVHSLNKKMHTS